MEKDEARDRFCADLDRKLQQVLENREAGLVERTKGVWGEHWWPFPDSTHHCELERQCRRPSMSRSSSSVSSSIFGTTASSHKRKLSVQDVWHDFNLESQGNLAALSNEEQAPQQTKKADGFAGQFEELINAAAQQQKLKHKRSQPKLNRSRSNLRMTKMAKPTPRETVYDNFDDSGFGSKRPCSLLQRRSSLAMELQPDEILIEEEDIDEEDAEKRLATIVGNSASGTPRDDVAIRRDSGYGRYCTGSALANPAGLAMLFDGEPSGMEFDFGRQTCVW